MDFSDKSSFSSSPSRRSATPQASPSDENDPTNRKMGSGRQSPNKAKPGVPKAFASRKKILAERNEASDPILSNTEKPQKFDPTATFADSEDELNGFVADSSSRPYDPLTNYLSPRPRFLRYQPNRRRQILLNLEKDGSGSGSSSSDLQMAVGEEGSWEETSLEKEIEDEIEEDEEEEEISLEQEIENEIDEDEDEEERGNWVLRGVLKSFMLFVVLALCTSYTSSMNSQTPALQTVWDMKDGFERIQDMITEAVKNLEGSEVEEMFGHSEVLWVCKDATVAVEDEEKVPAYSLGDDLKEEELEQGTTGDVDGSSENEEANVAEDSELLDREAEEIMHSFQDHETLVMSYDGSSNIVSDASLDVSGPEVEVVMKQEVSNKEEARDEEELKEGTTGDADDSSENEEANIAEDSELLDREAEEIMHSFQDHETPVMSYDGSNIVSDASLDVSGAEVEVVMKQEVSREEEARDEEEVVETQMEKRNENLAAGVLLDIKERFLQSESSILIGAAIGFSLIVASLVMGSLHLNRKRRTDTVKDGLIIKHSPEPETAEKQSSVVAVPMEDAEEKKEEQIVQVGSLKNASQSIQSIKEEDLMNHRRNAPRIQMLSEFVVSNTSVSMRNCSTEKRRPGIEEDQKKSPSSNYSGSGSVPVRSEMSESSSKNNLSFTAEKKMVRKKKSGGGKENAEVVVVATPVRRSTRIQSRSITSP